MNLRSRAAAPRREVRVRAGSAAAGRTVAVLLAGGLVAGCSTGADDGGSASGSTSRGSGSSTAEAVSPPSRTAAYLPGLDADVYEPNKTPESTFPDPSASSAAAAAPLVVLVPGGGWRSADRAGLAPLASALAAAGMTVVSVTYRTESSGTYFPGPLEDVACAIAFAAARAVPAGHTRGPLVVVGHSAGADLAALASLAPQWTPGDCPYPEAAPDAFVGMAGPYDVTALPEIAQSFFGVAPSADPDLWAAGNPLTYADSKPGVPALLLHGRDDDLVPVSFTTDFAAALRDGGHEVAVDLIEGAGHSEVYRADVAAAAIVDWIDALPELPELSAP